MAVLRLCLASLLLNCPREAIAAPPAPLANALEALRDQKSYSWEVINADPGPVAQPFPTRRGNVTLIQQNTSPHVKGSIDRHGDMVIHRDWADGLRLDTVITADHGVVTKTPEGWMTSQEVLTALAAEQLQNDKVTPRYLWLRRSDRPDLRRPDEELLPLLKSARTFAGDGDSYSVHGRINPNGATEAGADDSPGAIEIDVTVKLKNGLIRDYEVKVETTRAVSRARVQIPVSDQRIVILTYLPVSKIDLPDEVRGKLQSLVPPSGAKGPAKK